MITCALVVAFGALLGLLVGLRLFRDVYRFAVVSAVGGLVALVPASSLGRAEGTSANININLGFFQFHEDNMIVRIGDADLSWLLVAALVFIAVSGIAGSAYVKVNEQPKQ